MEERIREKVVIVGGGGHANVIIDIIRSQGIYEIVGCLDNPENAGMAVNNIRIVGGDDMLGEFMKSGVCNAFVAIGSNQKRAELAKLARDLGFSLINAISPNAYISESARLGCGIAVMPGAVINAGSTIMDNAIINTNASIDHDCIVGAGCHIGPGCALAGNVRVGEGSFLGTGTKVIPKISIGCWSISGAGAVLTESVADNLLVTGVPARVKKQLNLQGSKE